LIDTEDARRFWRLRRPFFQGPQEGDDDAAIAWRCQIVGKKWIAVGQSDDLQESL